jgi:hypothetical protein
MNTKLFISYAWTSSDHREWVRLLAMQLRLLGYTVLIDNAVDYGSSISGFMREVTEADRVLMVVDENYIERADRQPDSGVGIENKWIRSVFEKKSKSWLSVVFVGNPQRNLPAWLAGHRPKGFDFNSYPNQNQFPGIEQMDDLWRWLEGLPADKAHAVAAKVLLERMARIERIDAMRDPSNYANPALKDRVTFRYQDHREYTLGHGEYEFKVVFSSRSADGVYIYIDGGLKAVGLIPGSDIDLHTIATFLRPGRTAQPTVGQSVVMMNSVGALCVMKIEAVQPEVTTTEYIPSAVTFRYEILVER